MQSAIESPSFSLNDEETLDAQEEQLASSETEEGEEGEEEQEETEEVEEQQQQRQHIDMDLIWTLVKCYKPFYSIFFSLVSCFFFHFSLSFRPFISCLATK